MPAAPFPRQAAVSSWFEKAGAQRMRAAEHDYLLARVRAVPAQPWLWLAPSASWLPRECPDGRGVRLHRSADGRQWLGDVACSLPLPLPSEAVNAIVLQHAAGSGLDGLLSECARVLMPGGRLWLTALNRYSPYRVRWQWQDARPASLAHCRLRLRRDGLQVSARTHFGPLWHESGATGGKALPGLRAVSVIEFEKRTRALIGPEAVRAGGWRAPVAT